MITAKYGINPDDFEYLGSGRFVYKPKGRSTSTRQAKPKKQKTKAGFKNIFVSLQQIKTNSI